MKISAVVIAKNAEDVIRECFSSLKFCDEIIVVDNGSSDKTSDIAREFGAKVISEKSADFSKLRNAGLKETSFDWILYIDSDERVPKELSEEILLKIKNPEELVAFRIKRKNYYLGSLKLNEWPFKEKLERLFKKQYLKGWQGKIHESPIVEGEIGDLENCLLHFTHRDLSQMLTKTIEWSEIEADLRFKSDHPVMSWWRFPKVIFSAFFESYFKQGGYKAGTVGIIESIYQAFSAFITYAKLWEKQQESKIPASQRGEQNAKVKNTS